MSVDGRPPRTNAVEASLDQCVADAVEGSFDQYPPRLQQQLRLRGRRLDDHVEPNETSSVVRFSIGLPAELFPVEWGGLQLLVNLLAGDMFPTVAHGVQWSDTRVEAVEIPRSMRTAAHSAFRSSAHDVLSIRRQFNLRDRRPLLAYSLKPRVGSTFDEIRETTLAVLDVGFNIVELDSRHLALRSAPIEQWLKLGVESARVGAGRHVTAFSPNLSLPGPLLATHAKSWVEHVGSHGPAVIKVDGGLDGLSSLQTLRTTLPAASSPVVTCYPMLRRTLASSIGDPTWVQLLALSGVDIVYPGNRPTFPHEARAIWGTDAEAWTRSARRYDELINVGWPMPTVAGGIHPGHLHACYELLGPSVAYFLGGAVALHPDGPHEGARLCVEVLDDAIRGAERAIARGDEFSRPLRQHLLNAVELTRYPGTQRNYVTPEELFGSENKSPNRPQTFYRRRR